MPNLNILNNLSKYVKEEYDKDLIPPDAKYVIVASVDNEGSKILAAVNIHKGEKTDIKVVSLWHHDWDGDDTAVAKLVFVGK